MRTIGNLLKGLGGLTGIVAGAWGLFLCLSIMFQLAGFWGVIGGLFLGPLTFIATPLYSGFGQGNWLPLILNYGGSVVAGSLWIVGSAMAEAGRRKPV